MALFSTNLLDKSESVKLELKTFDEIFGEGWWEKGEAEDLKTPAPTNFGQNVPHQIDRQNTEIGQIEPNSTDQLGEIEPNSTDQNPPLTKSDHSDNAKNGEEKNNLSSNESIAEDERKPKLKRAGFKNSYKHEIDETVAKELGLSFGTISNWKRKLGQSKLNHIYGHSEQKELMKLYYEWKRQFKRQQFHPNSVDGHFVEENAAANVQEIGNSNSGKI
uniref:Uncharacterized protein n=1 Tax=Globodera rostochiensis TaxID=31243 RepID=A0A914HQA6_GLORO